MKKLLFVTLLIVCAWNWSDAANSKKPISRIVNGREAQEGQFPYQLSLRRQTIHICGAAVVSSSWAITAAHCIHGYEHKPKEFTLRMGSVQRSSGGTILKLESIHKHPSYNPENMNYDVALLRTPGGALTRDNKGSPIRLPAMSQGIKDNLAVVVSGWGHMSTADAVLSPILKYTTVLTVNQKKCKSDLRNHGGITDAMFCASERQTDACQGDSGGPVSVNGVLIGIVSWGVGCADPYYPGVYTRLAYAPIRRWIRLLTKK